MQIFQQAADNAEKLAALGATKINESCYALITSKAPKAKHYSNSSSSDFRVAAGVSQENIGTDHDNQVNSTLGLSLEKKKLCYFVKIEIKIERR